MGFDGSLFTGAVRFHRSRVRAERVRARLGRHVAWPSRPRCRFSFPVRSPTASAGARCCAWPPACSPCRRLLAALSENFATLIVARLLSGFGVGAVLIAAPMYIAEISPRRVARPHGVVQPAVHRVGNLAAFFSNYFIVGVFGWLHARTGTGAGCSASAWCRRSPISSRCWSFRRVRAGSRCTASCRGAPRARARSRRSELADAELDAVLASLEHEAARAKPALRGNCGSGAARSAHHRADGRRPAADHRHQLGAVVRRR